jgi:hypothetical protein
MFFLPDKALSRKFVIYAVLYYFDMWLWITLILFSLYICILGISRQTNCSRNSSRANSKTRSYHAMNTYGGVDVYIHILLTSALVGGEWSASRPGCFTPEQRAPAVHWIEGWVGAETSLDDIARRKILPLRGLELRPLGRPARSQSLYLLLINYCLFIFIYLFMRNLVTTFGHFI